MNTLSVIQEFLKDRLGLEHDRITPEARLEDLGIDSLMLLELLFEFEEKLGISLSNDMAMPETVGALLAIVEQYQAQPQTAD
ncbi:MAG: acyl carrier protein [Azospira sp.]|jgi:acyl carrier protein|nr:acyl carrier protein [Azospira sp.]